MACRPIIVVNTFELFRISYFVFRKKQVNNKSSNVYIIQYARREFTYHSLLHCRRIAYFQQKPGVLFARVFDVVGFAVQSSIHLFVYFIRK